MVMAAEKEEGDGSKKKKMEIIFRGYEEKVVRHKLNYRCNKFYKVDLNNDAEGVVEICKPLLISSCAVTMFCGGSYLFIAETRPRVNLDLIPDSIVVQDDKEDNNSKEMKIPCLKVISRIDINKKPLHRRKWVSVPSPYDHFDGSTLNFAALNNNIYCLGVISTPQVHTLVKGMEEKPWLHLTPPPSHLIGERLNVTNTIIPDPANNRILVHLTKGLNGSCGAIFGWHYNSEDGRSRWDSVAPDFNRWDCMDPLSTLADNIIFLLHVFNPKMFVAYDLSTKQWIKIEWSSPYPPSANQIREYEGFRGMMYLGNQVLCLSANVLLFHPEKCSRVYFLHFKFERSDDGSTITFTHQFNKSYDIPGIMGIQNFLLLD